MVLSKYGGRVVKSDIWRNDKIGELDMTGRCFYIGLITLADDAGRVKGNDKYLKASIFPYDDELTPEVINGCKDACKSLKLIQSFSVNGCEVLELTGWMEHQPLRSDRIKPSKLVTEKDDKYLVFGIFKNVRLTQDDYNRLVERYKKAIADDYIEQLSTYKKSRNKRYHNDCATIHNWIRRNKKVETPREIKEHKSIQDMG